MSEPDWRVTDEDETAQRYSVAYDYDNDGREPREGWKNILGIIASLVWFVGGGLLSLWVLYKLFGPWIAFMLF